MSKHGLALRGHEESITLANRGNFIEFYTLSSLMLPGVLTYTYFKSQELDYPGRCQFKEGEDRAYKLGKG